MLEIWKDIPDYESLYQVSNLGRVKSVISNKIMSPVKQNCGYLKIELHNKGKKKIHYVHRLVLSAFSPTTKANLQVNHKDGIKSNNRLNNLEWCSASENQLHAISIGLRVSSPMLGKKGSLNPLSKPILQFDKNGIFIKEWGSISQVSEHFNINGSCISNALHGRTKTSCGFVWMFKESTFYPKTAESDEPVVRQNCTATV